MSAMKCWSSQSCQKLTLKMAKFAGPMFMHCKFDSAFEHVVQSFSADLTVTVVRCTRCDVHNGLPAAWPALNSRLTVITEAA